MRDDTICTRSNRKRRSYQFPEYAQFMRGAHPPISPDDFSSRTGIDPDIVVRLMDIRAIPTENDFRVDIDEALSVMPEIREAVQREIKRMEGLA